MKTLRPLRRSLSPFGQEPTETRPFSQLEKAFASEFKVNEGQTVQQLKSSGDLPFFPSVLYRIWQAPANEAQELENTCRFLVRFHTDIETHGLSSVVYLAMQTLFDRKTELFLVDHHNREQCEKMEWPEDYRDVVLFAKERDTLVGHYFSPITEKEPGRFSEFINRWIDTTAGDRLFHFLDFCSGAKDPTFEHYLLFTHPALTRVVNNKARIKVLFDQTAPLLKKLNSPTWEKDVRVALGL